MDINRDFLNLPAASCSNSDPWSIRSSNFSDWSPAFELLSHYIIFLQVYSWQHKFSVRLNVVPVRCVDPRSMASRKRKDFYFLRLRCVRWENSCAVAGDPQYLGGKFPFADLLRWPAAEHLPAPCFLTATLQTGFHSVSPGTLPRLEVGPGVHLILPVSQPCLSAIGQLWVEAGTPAPAFPLPVQGALLPCTGNGGSLGPRSSLLRGILWRECSAFLEGRSSAPMSVCLGSAEDV